MWRILLVVGLILGSVAAGALGVAGAGSVRVVATTTIIGDVVARIGGEEIDLTVLFPVGVDPHAFEPTPRDAVTIVEADIIFANGLGLEEGLAPVLSNAQGRIVPLAESVPRLELAPADNPERADEDEHDPAGGWDPHVWLDPSNVAIWANVIASVLSERDPNHAPLYADRAERYVDALRALDEWIVAALSAIPDDRRRLVTDHAVLGHFSARYGFEEVGAVLPGFSTLADPSAREIAQLEDRILELGVRAVFVGTTARPELAERVAADTGISVVPLFTGSLSAPGDGAPTYIDLMRYNVAAIVAALGDPR